MRVQAAVRRVRDEWESKEREKEDIMVMALAENQGQRDSNRRLSSLDTQREGSSLVDRNDSAPDAPPSEDRLEDRAEALLARAKAKEEEEVRACVCRVCQPPSPHSTQLAASLAACV